MHNILYDIFELVNLGESGTLALIRHGLKTRPTLQRNSLSLMNSASVRLAAPATSHAACGFAALRAPAPLPAKGYEAGSCSCSGPSIGQ